jgi:protein-L-isoaspartate(D-aspartate) O-methyltransferase
MAQRAPADPLEERRRLMVEDQLVARDVRDLRLLQAFRELPRDRFVPAQLAARAYDDCALPIACGQTISQPYVVALMIEAAALRSRDRLLDVGTGSGYAAALCARLCAEVYTVERHAELADQACAQFAELGAANVHVRIGDGTLGWPEHAPFDAILVAAGGPRVPEALAAQLAVGGRLVMPVGGRGLQELVRITRAETRFEREDLGAVAFVPLVGAEGWEGDSR